MTNSAEYELQVDIWDWDDIYAVARYSDFEVGNLNKDFEIKGSMSPKFPETDPLLDGKSFSIRIRSM